jgi:uncharacterized delta-60 repeat protein
MIRNLSRVPTVLLAIYLTAVCVEAQLDPTFGTNGKTIRAATVKSFLLPDGKILVLTWQLVSTSASATFVFDRFNSDGTIDTTYGTNGSVTLPIPFIDTAFNQYHLIDAVRQPDGKIVAVGWDGPNGLVVRLNENGTLDTSFSGDGIHRPNINSQGSDGALRVVLQPDGKLVVLGSTQINFQNNLYLIRYEANGELDFVFGNQGGYIVHSNAQAWDVSGLGRQSNGKYIVLTVGTTSAEPQRVGRVIRFNTDGTIDSSFTSPTFTDLESVDLLVLSDDRIVVGGNPSSTDAVLRTDTDIKLTRLNAGGGLDSSFGNGGHLITELGGGMQDELADLVELDGGAIGVAATTFVQKNRSAINGYQMSVFTVGSGGTLTGRYAATDMSEVGESSNILRQADGKLIVVGSAGGYLSSDVVLTRHIGVPMTSPRFNAIPFEFTNSSFPLGISQAAVFRPSTSNWYASPTLSGGVTFGLSTDIPVAADYYGNLGTELAVFRPSNGTWYIARSYGNAASNFTTIQWGLNGDVPAAYDYDGDSKYDVAVFRPSNGNWYIRQSSNGAAQIYHWGITGDRPVVGDYDGDGLGDLAVWRPSSGVWYINRSSDGQAVIAGFGLEGDIPVQEDFDGDLRTDIAVYRPSTGVWYIWRSSDGGFTIVQFGTNGDVPVPADYDGDRKMDIAVYRPSTSRWFWIRSSGGGEQFTWGIPGDVAVQGRY